MERRKHRSILSPISYTRADDSRFQDAKGRIDRLHVVSSCRVQFVEKLCDYILEKVAK
jgi:hypothetical protein